MPCINVSVSVPVTDKSAEAFKSDMGRAITVFPGKSERWLMVCVEENNRLWLGGSNDAPTAYVEVSILGKIDASSSEKMTALICDSLKKNMGIPPERTYVKYEDTENWGWNGANF